MFCSVNMDSRFRGNDDVAGSRYAGRIDSRFQIWPHHTESNMRIGILSDLHCDLAPSRERRWINRYELLELPRRLDSALEIFSRERPDLLIILGDTTELGEREAFDFVFGKVRTSSGTPIAAVAGNHDGGRAAVVTGNVDGGVHQGALAASAPAHGIHFLDAVATSAAAIPLLGVGIARAAAPRSEYVGSLPTLPDDGPLTIVASHFPLVSHEIEITAAGLPYSGDLVNRARLEALLHRSGAPTVVLSGHVHSRCSAASGNVLQITVASMIESPFECTVVDIDVDDDSLFVRRRAFTLGEPAEVNPVFAPADDRWEWSNGWRR
jgi:predicted phosphodiesterase